MISILDAVMAITSFLPESILIIFGKLSPTFSIFGVILNIFLIIGVSGVTLIIPPSGGGDGLALGDALGLAEGDFEGDVDGDLLADTDGDIEGDTDGETDGDKEGLILGEAL